MQSHVCKQSVHPRPAIRQGSALLLTTLAATVLSLGSIAILRSSQRKIAQVDAIRHSMQSRCAAAGLFQRSIAILRTDINRTGTVTDPAIGDPNIRAELLSVAKDSTRVVVYLYDGATVPTIDITLDHADLNPQNGNGKNNGKGTGKGKGKGKGKGQNKGKAKGKP